MDIKTKFSVRQVVWLLHEDKVYSGRVSSISLLIFDSYQSEIYSIALDTKAIEKSLENIFESKQALIDSI